MLMLCLIFLSCFFAAFSLEALPPPVPSAGVIERQLEKEYEGKPLEPDKKVPDIQIDIPKEQLKLPEGSKVNVCEIRLQGCESIPCEDIYKQIQPKINCPLSITDIYSLCHIIETIYAEKGFFLARAFPPPQEIQNGKLIIEIMEGRLGHVQVVGNKHYKDRFILNYFERLRHKALNYDQFLRAIKLLNENSDLTAGAILEKGQELGEADAIIHVEDRYPVHLNLNGNDYGRFLTTSFRAGFRFDTQLLHDGDKLSLAEVVGFPINALYFTDVVYRFPINANGTFGELAFLSSRFHVEELLSLRIKGQSDIATVKLSHAVKRGRFLSCDAFANFDYKQIKNFTLAHLTSFDRLRLLTLGSILDHYSPTIGRNYLVLRMGIGLPNFLGGLGKPRPISSRPGAQGNFFKLNADYDFYGKLPVDSFFIFHTSGQWSPNQLTVPEQIYIGGADTVRGFPLASALGDSGYYMNIECRVPPFGIKDTQFFSSKKKWKDIVQFSAFVDHGGVFFKGGPDTFEWATGVGLRINAFWSLGFTAEVGFPLNHRDQSRDAFFYFKLTGQPF